MERLAAAARYEQIRTDREGRQWDMAVPTRVAAVEALAECEGEVVGEALAQALLDPQPDVRLAAARASASRETPEVVGALVDCVARWDDPVDEEAERIARETLVGWALEGLPEALAERVAEADIAHVNTRHRDALEALLAVDPRGDAAPRSVARLLLFDSASAGSSEREGKVQQILEWLGPPAADPIVESLESGVGDSAAIGAAGTLGDARAVGPLLALLETGRPDARKASALALGKIRDTVAVPALLASTRDGELGVRQAAADALNELGTAAVIVGVSALVTANGGAPAIEPQGPDVVDAPAGRPPGSAGFADPSTWQDALVSRLRRPK